MVLQSIDRSVRIKLHDPNAFNVKQNAAKVDNKGTNAALPYGIELKPIQDDGQSGDVWHSKYS